jgi:hypothetical protein
VTGENCTVRMRWTGYAACMGEKKNANKIFIGKPEGKRLVRSKHSWEGNIRMDLREIGWEDVVWIQMAQDRTSGGVLANIIIKLLVPGNTGNFLIS